MAEVYSSAYLILVLLESCFCYMLLEYKATGQKKYVVLLLLIVTQKITHAFLCLQYNEMMIQCVEVFVLVKWFIFRNVLISEIYFS